MTEETIFEKIVKGEIPCSKIYEDKHHFAFLDIEPFEKGHTLVIPKKPYVTITQMPEREYAALMRVVHKITKHYEEVLNCGFNIYQNNKEISGQEVPHVHVHIVPRKEKKNLYCMERGTKYLKHEAESYQRKLRL